MEAVLAHFRKRSLTEIVTGFYILVPLCLLIVMMDHFYHLGIVSSLPKVPEAWLAFNFLFNLPHIVESNILLCDKEVFQTYKTKLVTALSLSVLATLIFHYYLRWEVFLYIHSFWTLKHVVLQQFNLSHATGVKKNNLALLWKILGMLVGIIIYWDIYEMFSWKIGEYHLNALNLFAILFLITSFLMYSVYKKSEARVMVLANSLLFFGGYVMYKLGAGFFSVLLIRVIHDCTGFVYYTALNRGRTKAHRSPKWYVSLSSLITHVGATVLVPVCIVILLIALPFKAEVRSVFMVLSIMHYFTEGFTWKQGSPYRNYL